MLKSLKFSELEKIASELDLWSGAQVQEITGTSNEVGLRLHTKQENLFLWLDLNAQRPMLLGFSERFPFHRKQIKPVHLFMKAHVENAILKQARIKESAGRVLFACFEKDEVNISIEIRLMPHARNLSVEVKSVEGKNDKSVSWAPLSELPPHVESQVDKANEDRSWKDISQEWLALRKSKKTQNSTEQNEVKVLKKDLKKKEKAYEKVASLLNGKEEKLWLEVANWLQQNAVNEKLTDLHMPGEFSEKIDIQKSRIWNIENCFEKFKKEKQKKQGRIKQKKLLADEIDKIKKAIEDPKPIKVQEQKSPNLLYQAQVKGRQKKLREGLIAYKGRSGKENILLLRKAKPWHLWIHLKEEPSAHIILSFNKKDKPSLQEVEKAFQWLVEEHFKKADLRNLGSKEEVIVAECRFVQPIKGDRLGRVRYRNEKVYGFNLNDASPL